MNSSRVGNVLTNLVIINFFTTTLHNVTKVGRLGNLETILCNYTYSLKKYNDAKVIIFYCHGIFLCVIIQ